jgi:hypothetical protein
MIKIEIKNRFTGSIIFTYEKENATIKEAVLKALKEGANLYGANLRGANLENANLENANLENANLRGANLENANLRSANLENANLENANLENAFLKNANLENANLRGANLENANRVPMFCKWTHGTKGDLIQIGCKEKTIEDWDLFFASDETYETDRDTDDFKQIQAVYLAYKSYLTHLK